jgi:hypothetical protein
MTSQAETKRPAETEWDALLSEGSDSVVPTSYSKEGDVINRPNEGAPSAMRISDLKFKGYKEVWDTRTGVKSLQPWWLMWQTMRKRRPDGSMVFTEIDPKIPQDNGEDLFCPLNPNAPVDVRFAEAKGMGFKECIKKHIPNMAALMAHLNSSHKRAAAAINQAREEQDRQETMDLQREGIRTQQEFMNIMMSQASGQTLTQPRPDAPTSTVNLDTESSCSECDKTFSGKMASAHLARHQRTKHT